jgi:hypothetical protein
MLAEYWGNNIWLMIFMNRSVITMLLVYFSFFSGRRECNVRAVSTQAVRNVATLGTGRECFGHGQ